jgi:predicted nucleic acid-binding protein
MEIINTNNLNCSNILAQIEETKKKIIMSNKNKVESESLKIMDCLEKMDIILQTVKIIDHRKSEATMEKQTKLSR